MANAIFYQNNVGFKIYSGAAYVDLTDHVIAATINRSFDELDVTSMGALGHQFIAGLESSTVSIDFLNDDSTGQVMQVLNGLVGTNAAFKMLQTVTAIGALTSTGTVSATNQLYTGNLLINKITPIAGKVGDVSVQSLTFTVSGSITVASSGTW